MKISILLIFVVLVIFTVSCGDENLPAPQEPTTENTESGGDDAEDPIIED